MLKLLFKKTHPDVKKGFIEPELPELSNSKVMDLTQLTDHLKQYDAMTHWPEQLQEYVHPAYLAMQALTLQEPLISDSKQPFAGLGLVHMGNKMQYERMFKKSEKLVLSCAFGQLWEHKLGWVFSVNTTACSIDAPAKAVLTLESHYLYRQSRKPENSTLAKYNPEKIPFLEHAHDSHALSQKLAISKSMARSYAALSGDFNPIHLFTWSARLFGFKQPIIHGMWTKASVLSAWFSSQTTENMTQAWHIDVQFMRFISLPNTFSIHTVNVIEDEGVNTTYLAGMPTGWTKEAKNSFTEPVKPYIQVRINTQA